MSWVTHCTAVSCTIVLPDHLDSPPSPSGVHKVLSRSSKDLAGQLVDSSLDQLETTLPPWAIRAGARQTIYFDPSQVGRHEREGRGAEGDTCP